MLVVCSTMILVRQRFIPESFGELGHYRADAVEVNASHEIQFAGWQACAECHDDQVATKNSSFHRTVSCETCHGPAAEHAREEADEDPPLPTGRDLCLTCHRYLVSRPTGFPQIISASHNPRKPCVSCHDPHDPVPPETPAECEACHATIARTKALSDHVYIDCTRCHVAVEEHKVNPRRFPPDRPDTREFCGECHGRGLGDPDITKVDMESHGAQHVCWQCHYPHLPEVN